MTDETIMVKRADLEEIRRVWVALDGLDGILSDKERDPYHRTGTILKIIMDKFNNAMDDIDDRLRESA